LKGNKFRPVLTHELLSSNTIAPIDPTASILCEIHRPPWISCIRTRKTQSGYTEDEIRLPGSPLIGQANVWLLKIGSEPKIYEDLASLITQYHLCSKDWQMSNTVPLLTSIHQHAQQTIHIDLLIMKEWREKNLSAIERFVSQQWPFFPFETKFEIMKLISKHIITINDLILDERLQFILGKMSFNTLAACIGKSRNYWIFEFI
jgi:hypothetical protein